VSGKGRQSALRRRPGLPHPPPQHALVDAQIIGCLTSIGFSLLFVVHAYFFVYQLG
jgi:hypothetical protein